MPQIPRQWAQKGGGGGGTIWREFLFTENEAKKADKKPRKNVREREEGDEEYL